MLLQGLQSRPFGSKEPLGKLFRIDLYLFRSRAHIDYLRSAPRSQIYATASFQPSHVTHIGNFNAAGQPKERTASADNSDDSAPDDDPSDDDTPGVLRQAPLHNRVSDLQAATGEESKKSKRQKNKNPEYLCRNCGRNDSPEWRKVCEILSPRFHASTHSALPLGSTGTEDALQRESHFLPPIMHTLTSSEILRHAVYDGRKSKPDQIANARIKIRTRSRLRDRWRGSTR